MQPNQPGFGARQAYPNGYSAHPGGYPMSGTGPHPGAQPGPYGAPPGVNPPPYPGVQQQQRPLFESGQIFHPVYLIVYVVEKVHFCTSSSRFYEKFNNIRRSK